MKVIYKVWIQVEKVPLSSTENPSNITEPEELAALKNADDAVAFMDMIVGITQEIRTKFKNK